MTDLAKTPWVDKAVSSVWSRIAEAAPKRAWIPKHTAKRGGKVTVEEYGCGHYGCVMPTDDPEVVCKITSDATEAVFVAAALILGFGEETEGIVRYYGVYELPAQHRGRPTFVLWREAATEVGLKRTNWGAPTYEDRRDANLLRYLGFFKDFAAAARDSLKRSSDPDALLLAAKKYEGAAWDYISDIDFDRVIGSVADRVLGGGTGLKGPHRIAVALRACDVIAELMESTDGSDLIGSALRYYLEKGLLLADVHGNNVGKVARTSGWVITDPGHAVGLEPRWRAVTVPRLP